MNELEERPTIFENVKDYPDYKVVGGLCSSRELIAEGLGISVENLISKIVDALNNPKEPELVERAPCQELVVEKDDIDLEKLPILVPPTGRWRAVCHRRCCNNKRTDDACVIRCRHFHTNIPVIRG